MWLLPTELVCKGKHTWVQGQGYPSACASACTQLMIYLKSLVVC
jgi:hypothetical protein